MKNNHQLIIAALGVGLEDASDNHGKEITIEQPHVFDSEMEPVTSRTIVQIDGVPYSVTIAREV